MKRVCFLNFEGVLLTLINEEKVSNKINSFLETLTSFTKENNIELFLISGFNEAIAKQKFLENNLNNFFDEKHFVFVNEEYINNKTEEDKKLHKNNLEKNPAFVDSFFKQVFIKNYLEKNSLEPKNALLLCSDVWVDGYYTTRFTKIDFALFKENLTDRGNKTQKIEGLIYFELNDSVINLLKEFPAPNYSFLDEYVFETMKSVLVSDEVKESIKKSVIKKKLGDYQKNN